VRGLVEIDRCQTRAEAEQRVRALTVAGIQCSLVPVGDAFGIYVEEYNVGRASECLAIYEEAFALPEPTKKVRSKGKEWLFGYVPYAALLGIFFLAHQTGLFSINWVATGSSQAGDIADGAWWRTITSLTLHAEFGHLLGNLIFGVAAGYFVAQCFGPGLAWFLILLAGSLGNGINAFVHSPEFTSIGASTGLFGGLGILSGYSYVSKFAPWRRGLRRWLPIAAGITLLTFLGFGGENADVLGHILGFGAGVAIGLVVARDPQRLLGRANIQRDSGVLACILVSSAWLLALLD
jgi:membrane associated rhomboid family serine protease